MTIKYLTQCLAKNEHCGLNGLWTEETEAARPEAPRNCQYSTTFDYRNSNIIWSNLRVDIYRKLSRGSMPAWGGGHVGTVEDDRAARGPVMSLGQELPL